MAGNPNIKMYGFKPGQSGNPSGKPKGLLTRAQVEVIFQAFSKKNRAELQEVIDDKKSTMLQIMIASVMIKAAKDGDYARLQFLLDRAVGKVATVTDSEEDREMREARERMRNKTPAELVQIIEGKKSDNGAV